MGSGGSSAALGWRRQYNLTGALEMGYHQQLNDCRLWSRVGSENFLLAYAAGRPLLTPFYQQVLDYLQGMGEGPKSLILDTLADLFGGNEIERVQANYFVKTTLGSIGIATNSTILLLAHPSRSGLAQGDLLSGSTAWHNAVRSRLALQWMKDEDGNADPDMINQRILTRPKANYAQANAEIVIEYKDGAFFPIQTAKSSFEELGIRQTIKDEIAAQAARGTPLSYFDKAGRAVRRHRFMRQGRRIMPADVAKAVDALIDLREIELYEGRARKSGLYPTESTV